MLIRFLRFIRGTVRFRASGGFFEKFLSLLAEQNLDLWAMETQNGETTGTAYASDYRTLASLARRCGVRLRIEKKRGLPFVRLRHRSRIGVLIGAGIFLILIVLTQNFVWTVEIVGNEHNSSELINHVLAEYGLRPGAFLPALNVKQIEDRAVLELDGVAWMSINNYGSKVRVEMEATGTPPEIIDDELAANVVAKKAGLIRRTEVYAGKRMVSAGDVVTKGDLLISGVLDSDTENVSFGHARGKIFAETYTDEVFTLPKEEILRTETGNRFDHRYLSVLGCRIPLFFAFAVPDGYRATVEEKPFCFFGVELPVGIETLHYREYHFETVSYDREQAENRLKEIYENYKETQMEGIELLDETVSFTEEEEEYRLTVSMICYEDIAMEQKLFES